MLNPRLRISWWWAALVAGPLLLSLVACSTAAPDGVQPVTPFDIARYEGKWYEIARLDHSFERGLSDVSARYQRQSDGTVQVINRGFDASRAQWKDAVGRALFIGDANTASLKVSFFGPFYGGYHVAALDADYQWTLVVGPDRSYFRSLSRTQQLDPSVRQQLIARAQALGIDTQALIWVSHDRTDPQP